MRVLIGIVLVVIFASSAARPAAAEGTCDMSGFNGGVGGSYQQSCNGCAFGGSELTATCGDGHGGHKTSSVIIDNCQPNSVSNQSGQLKCTCLNTVWYHPDLFATTFACDTNATPNNN